MSGRYSKLLTGCIFVLLLFFTSTDIMASNSLTEDMITNIDIRNTPISESMDYESYVIRMVVDYAKEFVGVRYVYGGTSPKGFDCSGFIGYVYKNFGIELSRSAQSMYSNGKKVSRDALKAGDILFFDASSRNRAGAIDHVGIYLGGDNFIHASSSKGSVRIQKLSQYKALYIGAKRVI
ncbi:C40 family peptidase [Ruminiclostridium cellulolyticum]|uniref:NLP/P60 protein n=1 Tax=Ruminiclostridium cellulolyticum (strain ATCC 35319 / DSM 5812 / JCM 6584 / H10) TaxID=394503 RepID=B8I2L0_RUMCH|nr:C40 family peptidase [Ruminiclostridium cellulolyticum]ACL76003.1 NLP/P60 protein [Ruminiclostridium cellulolyticum H10]